MPYVELTRDKKAIVDAEDVERVGKFKWHARRRSPGTQWEASRHLKRLNGSNLSRTLANEIMQTVPGMVVDHVNGNPLDNRKENLRLATPAQNAINWMRNNKTGVRGVFANGKNRFAVRIKRPGGKRLYLGTFLGLDAAKNAYAEAAAKFHGPFAVTKAKEPSHV
jgi:hypothetical protein